MMDSLKSVDNIVPIIKPSDFGLATEVYNLLPEDEMEGQLPLVEPFVADLVIAYAWSLQDRYEFINVRQLPELQLSLDELHEVSIKNLFRFVPELSVQDLALYNAILAGNDLEASTLLMSGVWDQLASESVGRLQMVVPTRDAVYFRNGGVGFEAGSDTVSSEVCMEAMLDAARAERRENTSRRVSNYVFEWTQSGWNPVDKLGTD